MRFSFVSFIHLFVLNDNTPGLGASGALMGLVAAAILLKPFAITWEGGFPIPILLLGWLALIADVTGLFSNDNIGHLAHLGGFVSIMISMKFLTKETQHDLWKGFLINIVLIALSVALFFWLRSF